MGACIALHAARKCDPLEEPVILIEKDRLGAGSSGRSGAISGTPTVANFGNSRRAVKAGRNAGAHNVAANNTAKTNPAS